MKLAVSISRETKNRLLEIRRRYMMTRNLSIGLSRIAKVLIEHALRNVQDVEIFELLDEEVRAVAGRVSKRAEENREKDAVGEDSEVPS